MTSRWLEISIGLRLLGLLALGYAAEQAAVRAHYGWLALLLLALGLAVVELARHVTRGTRSLADFLRAVQYRDFAQHYNEHHPNRALRPLHTAYNELNATFRQLSAERAAQYAYLQTVLELIDTGIISFDADEQVEYINEAFKQTLELPYLRHIATLRKRLPALYAALRELRPGASRVVRVRVAGKTLQLLLSASAFRREGRAYTLVAFKNVSHALDETEAEAWQKILRVMTHEIMNSVTPIASLADTLRRDLARELAQPGAVGPAGLADVLEGIGIIQHRSAGLLRFAQVYRDFSTISAPHLAPVPAQALLATVGTLLQPQLDAAGIRLHRTVEPPELELRADRSLLEQVLINLILNAAAALAGRPQPRIQLRAQALDGGRVQLQVIDNGAGIAPEVLDSIFIPFFTTRVGGTGIGLSLVKQIVHLHGGSISVQTQVGEGTAFLLEL